MEGITLLCALGKIAFNIQLFFPPSTYPQTFNEVAYNICVRDVELRGKTTKANMASLHHPLH